MRNRMARFPQQQGAAFSPQYLRRSGLLMQGSDLYWPYCFFASLFRGCKLTQDIELKQ